jgi:hypothetical protein
MTVRNMGLCTIKIGDNPYESQFVKGEKYLMTAQVGVEFISGATKAPNAIFQLAHEVSSTTTTTSCNYSSVSDLSLKSTSIGDKHTIKWWTEGFGNELPRMWFNMKTRQHLLIRVSNLKIEKINGNNFTPTVFNGLGKLHSVAQPNLLNGSGVLGKAFSSYTPDDCTVSTIPYGYCNNTVKTIKANKVTRYNKYNKFFTYQARVQNGTTYTLSWYQKGTTTNEQKFFVSIANKDNAVPSDWLIYCGGEGPKLWHKKSNDKSVYNSHLLTTEWTRHYMTFCYSGSTSDTCPLDIDFVYQFDNKTYLSGATAYFAMPKLEVSDYPTPWQASDQDRSTKPLRGPMAWVSGTTYQGGGVDDEFQDLVTFNNANAMYLCKCTHTAETSNNPANGLATGGWDTSKPWVVTEKKDFIAADVIWTDSMKAGAFDAIKGKVDELTIGKLQTNKDNGPTLEIKDGNMVIKGQTGVKNIEIGINENGEAVLRFYNNKGDYLYDLGPDKITDKVARTLGTFMLLPLVSKVEAVPGLGGDYDFTTLGTAAKMAFRFETQLYQLSATVQKYWAKPEITYKFNDGILRVGNVTKYTAKVNGATDGEYIFSRSDFDGAYFEDSGTTQNLPNPKKLLGYDDNIYHARLEYANLSPLGLQPDNSLDFWNQLCQLSFIKKGIVMSWVDLLINCYYPKPGFTSVSLDGDWNSKIEISNDCYHLWVKGPNNTREYIGACNPNGNIMRSNYTFAQYKEMMKNNY